MPTYEYQCQQCRERTEAVQKFSDAALTVCPNCGGELRKVFSAVGIVFKGSGFYKNDSRPTSSKSTTTSTSTTTEATKTASEPAAASTSSASATPSTTPATSSNSSSD